MRFKKILATAGIGALLLTSSMSFTSCTSKITEEQLAMLQELRKKEKSLNVEISGKQAEISKIESEISSRKSELKDCTDKADFVKQKLSQWPNVWPDYTPNK